jgi:hypothetical protein
MDMVGKQFVLWPHVMDMPTVVYRDQYGVVQQGRRVEREIVVTVRRAVPSTNSSDDLRGQDLIAYDHNENVFRSYWDPNTAHGQYHAWLMETSGQSVRLANAVNYYNEHVEAFIRPDNTRAIPKDMTICQKHDIAIMPGDECFECWLEHHKVNRRPST